MSSRDDIDAVLSRQAISRAWGVNPEDVILPSQIPTPQDLIKKVQEKDAGKFNAEVKKFTDQLIKQMEAEPHKQAFTILTENIAVAHRLEGLFEERGWSVDIIGSKAGKNDVYDVVVRTRNTR